MRTATSRRLSPSRSVGAGREHLGPTRLAPRFEVAPTGHRVRMGTNLGRLLLRVTVGSIFIEHGTPKLFGWFGGHGPSGARWAAAALGGALAGSALAIAAGRQHAEASAGDASVSGQRGEAETTAVTS